MIELKGLGNAAGRGLHVADQSGHGPADVLLQGVGHLLHLLFLAAVSLPFFNPQLADIAIGSHGCPLKIGKYGAQVEWERRLGGRPRRRGGLGRGAHVQDR